MTEFISSAFAGTSPLLALTIDMGIKATILLVLCYAAHAVLGRRHALARSALWNATLVGLTVLPLAILALPRIRVAVLAAIERAPTVTRMATRSGSLPENAAIAEEPSAKFDPIASPLPDPVRSTDITEPAAIDRAPRRGPGIAGLVPKSYLLVAALLAIRLIASLAAIGGLKRRCAPVEDAAWTAALERIRANLGIGRRVMLVKSNRVFIPMVVGWLRPVIILPDDLAQTAGAELIDMVLLHELAHVRRGDFAWNLLSRAVRVVYWPHPLVWPAGRIIGTVREQACDDLCVHETGGAVAYRAALLEVASRLIGRPELSLGLAMARTTHLARRLKWIDISEGRSRCLLSLPGRFGMAVAATVFAGVLGSVELERQTLAASQQKDAGAPEAALQAAQPNSIDVVVVAKDSGKRLAGARVRFSIDFQESLRTADGDGVVRLDLTQRKLQDSLSFDAWADGYVQQRFSFAQNDARYSKIPTRAAVELLPAEETLGGKVVDQQKRPIAGANVVIWGHLGEKKDRHEMAYMVDATTNDKGEWRCHCFRGMKWAYLYLSHPDHLSDSEAHPREHGQPERRGKPAPGSRPASDHPLAGLRDFSDVEVMTAGVSLAGTVTDERDKPIAGAEIGWLDGDGSNPLPDPAMPVAWTNAAGQFRFPHVRRGPLVVQIKAKGYAPELKRLNANDTTRDLTVKLRAPRSLSGQVVDSGGKPVPDALVTVGTWRGSKALGVFFKSDAHGRFRWDDAPSDVFTVGAGRTGFASISEREVSTGTITLILKRSLAISGRISDRSTDKPIDAVDVEVGVVDANTGDIVWTREQTFFAFQGGLHGTIDVENRPELRVRVRATGYEPTVSRVFRRNENQVEYDFKLSRAGAPQGVRLSGVVRRPDGAPLDAAVVAVSYARISQAPLPLVSIRNGKLDARNRTVTAATDAQGRFSLGREPDPAGKRFAVIVLHPEFFAEVDRSAFESNSTITARPWGRIEGVAYERGKRASGASIRYAADRFATPDDPIVHAESEAIADAQGRFVLEHVVPGDVRVARAWGQGTKVRAWSNGELVVVRSGETASARVGGNGRPVIAKVLAPAGFDPDEDYTSHSTFFIESERPQIPYPRDLMTTHDGSMLTWGKQWWASAEGHEYRQKWYSFGQAKLERDGSIRVEDVPPGDYRLRLTFSADPLYGPATPERIAFATKQFAIPDIPGGRTDEPFDLGVLRPEPKQTLAIGRSAPLFEVETLEGGRLKLEDFRGKFVLLDFWATWCGPCIAEVPSLKALHDRFAKDERFALISLSLDADKEAPRKFVAERAITWKQGYLGHSAEGGVQKLYHVESIPAIFLIGPDGTLLSRDLKADAIEATVVNVLVKP